MAPVASTRGQLPLLHLIRLPTAPLSLAAQYVAAEYCEKRSKLLRRLGEISVDHSSSVTYLARDVQRSNLPLDSITAEFTIGKDENINERSNTAWIAAGEYHSMLV